MIKITKENIIPYLKEHLPDFDDSLPVNISMVGEGTEEEDGDGYVNYIYRVQTPKESLVLKQGTEISRRLQHTAIVLNTIVCVFSMRLHRNMCRILSFRTGKIISL